ncbi:rho guanine nucleotide exchange factor 19-like [Hyla sarda]|uniref:rho guanine nucleotide exchange factor 19-like n=1 Tax=Hyla sarda TaxID=327740 RepID=UPI0024C302FD|nr:rho guanine nucleotide exchange factor 19-like [Hyla sarda]XP_056399542.1 rho guanine nucleotide exchange factor 19-like [Hyla sarda]
MALFCRKRSYPDSPPPVEVTVKRCASCPVACTPHVNLHRCLDDRGLLPRLFRHKKSRKQVTGGKWKSYDDVTLQSMTSQHLEGQDPSEGEFGKSKVFNNPIYQPPVCTTPPHDSSTGPQETEDPKIHIEEASPDTTSQNPSLQMKTPQEPSLITSPPEQSLIGRLMKESRRWKRKESKFVHTQPLYQDYCVYYTKGAPGLSPSVFSVDTSLSFAGLISSSLLGSQVINASPPLYTSSLWQELPEVKVKGIVQTMSPQKRQLQEAIFEVVASEASYLRSLSVAIGHFQKSRRIQECLGTSDRHTLFSNLPSVREVSERFLLDLEEGLEKDLYLSDIGERVLRHCPEFKRVYIPYVTNQMYQEKLMQQLIRENARFLQVLQKLEEQPVCKRQLLKSFLVLPFQRITRLKILLENILKLAQGDVELSSSLHNAASAVGEIVSRCNEGVRCMMQTEELVLLEKRMDFHHTKSLPLISRGRALVQHGELVRIFFQELGIGHKPRLASKPIYIHLFSDLLLLSSRTDAGRFQVTDYARRGQVKADNVKAKALGLPTLVFLLRLTQNHSGLSCEIVLQATNEFEKEHWISQITRQMSQESSC